MLIAHRGLNWRWSAAASRGTPCGVAVDTQDANPDRVVADRLQDYR